MLLKLRPEIRDDFSFSLGGIIELYLTIVEF